jgi:hypothetical protein
MDVVCKHMTELRTVWTFEKIAKAASKYPTRSQFKKGSPGAHAVALKSGIMEDVCAHMKTKQEFTNWTFSMLAAEAAKYSTRSEFDSGHNSAYRSALRRGILNDICGHMSDPPTKWDRESISAEALKYQTRTEFKNSKPGAYFSAHKYGIMDDICKHMDPGSQSDNDAIYIWHAVGHRYNGKNVYKIGVTSARLEDRRIIEVARAHDTDAKIVILKTVEGKATEMEAELLQIGNDPQYIGNGATEFRAMDDAELGRAVALIQETDAR